MRKSLWLTIAVLLMMAVLSACTAPPVAMETMSADAAPAADAPVRSLAALTVDVETASSAESLDIWADETRAPVMEMIGQQLTDATGVPVTVTELPFDDIRSEFEAAAPKGEGPDIIVGSYGWLGQLVNDGMLAEVDLGDKSSQFLDSAVDAFELNGVLYGMPYATENVALVYNPELVPEPPATWSELTVIAAQLEDEGKVLQGFMRQTGDPYHFYPTESAFGGYIFGDDSNGYDLTDIGAESAGTLAAFQWLDQMYAEGHLNPETVVDYDIMHSAFEAGHTAMIVTGPWALPRLRASGAPFVVTTLPAETQAATPFMGVQGFMVSQFSENPALAQRFLTEFVATDEIMAEIFQADPRPSAFLSVREYIEDPDVYGFAIAGENGVPIPNIPQMAEVWDDWNAAIIAVSQQTATPEEALQVAADQIRAEIANDDGE